MKSKLNILIFCLLAFGISLNAQEQYSDVLIDAYYSGANPDFVSFYGADGNLGIKLINPNVCIGNTGYFVSLPTGSYVTVGFVDNLIYDAPDQDDIFIQEKGGGSELADIFLSSDFGQTFTYFGKLNGGTTNAIDLEDIGYDQLVNAIKIVGLDNNGSSPGFDVSRVYGITGANCSANADIDFPIVCQDSVLDLQSLSPTGMWSGTALVDNQLMTQDTGTYYVTHIVEDEVTVCPSDTAVLPIRITPCDCSGTSYGTFEIDDCDVCGDPLDSLFSMSCVDCSGIPFGNATYDDCNVCLSPDDPNRCDLDNILYIPNAFSPNGDGFNDVFEFYFRPGIEGQILEFSIYNRWGELIYTLNSPSLRNSDGWWNGLSNDRKLPEGVYLFHIRIQLESGTVISQSGDLTLIR